MGWRKPGSAGDAGGLFERRKIYCGAGIERGRAIGVVDWIVQCVAAHVVVECAGGNTFSGGTGDAKYSERNAVVDTCTIPGTDRAGSSNCAAVRISVRYRRAAHGSRLRRRVGRDVVAQSELAACG